MTFLSSDLGWWVTVVDLPAMAGLCAFIWRTRRDFEREVDAVRSALERRSEQLRDALSGFKLEVAKNYASQNDLRELESRIVSHLLRIESKLDATALKAEALKGSIRK